MKYCLQFIGLLCVILIFSMEGVAQTSPASSQRIMAIEICDNGKDDDGDGDIDCNDSGCAALPYCRTENDFSKCRDGLDNDGDGDIDCADSECNCPTTETICNDGFDDDGDGLIDCEDGDCADFNACFEGECNNGVDDDGDGFFDYYDGDCLDNPDNPNNYIITKPDCEARPVGNVFDVSEAWRSGDWTSNNRGIPVVADIDNDGTPEVITQNGNNVYILSGVNGDREYRYGYPDLKGGDSMEPLAVGDVDNDGYGELFHLNDKGYLRAMDYNPNSADKITTRWQDSTHALLRFPALADFNRDGKAELYYSNEIRDALTGDLIIAGSHGTSMYTHGNDWFDDLNGLPVAVDILPTSTECPTCDGLELVLGHVIYAVDINGGSMTEAMTMDDVPDANKTNFTGDYYPKTPGFGKQSTSTTAVVDYNQDGYLDVIMSGAIDKKNGPSTIFFWDVHNNTASAFIVTRPASTIPATIPNNSGGTDNFRTQYKDLNSKNCDDGDDCTWIRGVGSLNIANIDNDTDLECTFMSGSSLYAIESDMSLKWANHTDFWESTSGMTGTAVFDFDGDGASEVIYRDQVNLYIVGGEDGQVLNSQYNSVDTCSSNTGFEYPIVADVDGDGETEVIVSCSEIVNKRYRSASTSGGSKGHIRAYKAAPNQFWVPARRIWNQYTYFNVNVNDNMTIPRYQQPHHLNFSEMCSDGSTTSRFSLNKFLNQSPRITYCGDLAFPASKLDFADDGVVISPPVCPEDSFEITLSFQNTGDYAVNQPIPFAFYSQDPTQAYGDADENPWMDTLYLEVPGGIQPDQRVDTTVMVRGERGQFTLYVSMNDVGPFDKDTKDPIANSAFYALTSLNGTVRECDGTPTIVARQVEPIPFGLTVYTKDNRRCSDEIGINNGEIYIQDEDGDALSPLGNYRFTLTDTLTGTEVDISSSIVASDTVTTIQGLDSGIYYLSVQYINDAYSCGSMVDTIVINRIQGWPEEEVMAIEKIKDVSSCKPGTTDGEARVLIDGELPDETTYEVRWQNEQDPSEIIFGSHVTNLKPVTYDIFVTNLLTGCAVNDSSLSMDLPPVEMDDPTVTHSTNCKNANGSISANMASGPIGKYDFQLIQKSPVQNTTISTNGSFTGLSEGIYELRAYDPTNECGLYSEGLEVIIENNTVPPAVTLAQISPQTACEAPYNGHLRATPDGGGNYDYVWYRGTVTTGSTAEIISTTADATGLSTYGNTSQVYTVEVTARATGCTFTGTINLLEDITYPEVDPADVTVTARTYCATPNGTLSASVGGVTDDFEFELYEGTVATGTPFATSVDGTFTGLDSITYTVVAIDTRTGCVTPATQAIAVKVPGNTKAPVVVPTVTPQTACNILSPNGAISVTADGSTSTTDYTFSWVNPDGTTVTNVTTLSDLARGDYQLTVQNVTTGCDTTLIVSVQDDINENATVAVITRDVTDCTPYNGEAEVGSISGFTGDLSLYEFTWYKISESGLDSTEIVGQTGPLLTGLEDGTYSVIGYNTNTECETLPQRAVVGTTIPDPVITIVPDGVTVDDCLDRDGEFKLDVMLGGVDVSGMYTYDWYLGSEADPANYIHTGQTITGIVAGTFTIVATSTESHGCATTAVIDMADVLDFLPVFVSDPIPTHIEMCGNPVPTTGEVFAQVELPLFPDSDHDEQADYAFYWFAGRSLPPLPGGFPGEIDTTQALTSILDTSKLPARGDNSINGHRLIGLAAGEYTVAVYNIPDGCYASKYTEILQIAREPVITLVPAGSKPEELCAPGPDGRLEVTVGKRSGDTTPSATPAYDYAWYAGTSASGPVLSTTAVLDNQPAGQYTVQVIDRQTSCSAERTFTIRDERNIPAVTASSTSGVNVCTSPQTLGSVTVTQVTGGGSLVTVDATTAGNYTFYLYSNESDYNSASPSTNSLPVDADGFTFSNLAVGTYYVAVADVSNGCPASFLHEVDVPDATPEMILSLDDVVEFVSCTDAQEGEIEVSITGTTDAHFFWYAGTTDTGTPIADNTGLVSRVIGLTDGEYTVRVEDQTGQACDVTQTFTVPRRAITPILSAAATAPQTICTPDGAVAVTDITLDGASQDLNGYGYVWYYETLDAAGNLAFESQTRGSSDLTTYTGLAAGIYFVEATGNGTLGAGTCPTDVVQVTIEDDTDQFQVINDYISDPILACRPSDYFEGEIEIKAGYLRGAGFEEVTGVTTEWYYGSTVDPSQEIPGTADATHVTGLAPGEYTVRVTDASAGCIEVRQYIVPGIEVPLAAFPSAQPQISCTEEDGAVGVTINGGRGDYVVNWYAGTSTTSTPINGDGSYYVEGLASGIYTVTVTDATDTSCDPVTEQIVVEDRSFNDLAITVDSDFPMSNCDESNPNGQLSATIEMEENLFRYEFFWYEGTTTAGTPVAFGPTAINLGENTYTVVARDRITGCISDPFTGGVITLLDSGRLPAPTVRMVSLMTHCTNPNGEAEAILDPALTADPNVDYEFIWSNDQGDEIFRSDRTNVASQLDTGRYTVIARNTISGCISDAGEVYITDSIGIPEFEIITTMSLCDKPSGTVELVFMEQFDVQNVEWTTPYGYNDGYYLDAQPAGRYEATITGKNGCQITREAYVIPGIVVYNAVSPNGDQQNDIFKVSCIEDFENNLVQIFNRSGSLVYEHVGYDNKTIFFNGYGNRGVYVGGKELPDGTYFYVVDKRNGDEPESGYLELLR